MSALLALRRIAPESAHWAFILTVGAALASTFLALGDRLIWPQNLLLGEVRISSAAGQGFTLEVELPG